ncbi:MAG: acyl-CoA dehydrogenase family protein [Microthrixaceae bacterium]|nr:acyl-CoA dehydrogenase family protein [Microthrixaceae bacterium]MCO5319492.1 acyl-CoA dehydrogenase family protein [Microthrixaceae bacterium]
MHLAYTPEQLALRDELRAYYQRLLTDDVREELHREVGCGPTTRSVVKQMAADGWLGIGWPTEYGGQGRDQFDQFIFYDESMRSGAPVPMLTINTVGPTIMEFGTDDQKKRFLPPILAGDLHFCIGYSEPEAGTDLASLRTRAVRDGDEWVVNGTKMWTSLASDADFCWLAVRTNPDAPKHKGISILAVDMKSPGIEVNPLHLMSSHDINETVWNDVRVPDTNLVGGEGGGWNLIVNQLNHERVTLLSPGLLEQSYMEVRAWAQRTTGTDGKPVIDSEWVQVNLAKVHSGLEFLRLVNWKVAAGGDLDVAQASTVKTFGSEFFVEAFRLLMEVLGPAAYLERDSVGSVLKGRLEMNYRSLLILTFGGGTNEIQRDLIAMFGLGMPRAMRM